MTTKRKLVNKVIKRLTQRLSMMINMVKSKQYNDEDLYAELLDIIDEMEGLIND